MFWRFTYFLLLTSTHKRFWKQIIWPALTRKQSEAVVVRWSLLVFHAMQTIHNANGPRLSPKFFCFSELPKLIDLNLATGIFITMIFGAGWCRADFSLLFWFLCWTAPPMLLSVLQLESQGSSFSQNWLCFLSVRVWRFQRRERQMHRKSHGEFGVSLWRYRPQGSILCQKRLVEIVRLSRTKSQKRRVFRDKLQASQL